MLKMAHYEPLDAIMDVPNVQEARSGEFYQERSINCLCYVYYLAILNSST